jgi:hypothetical protein
VSNKARNNVALRRFELDADGAGSLSAVAPIITFTHTEVPPRLRVARSKLCRGRRLTDCAPR